MITSILLLIISFLIKFVCLFLPTWQIWPRDLLDGLSYFFSNLITLNFLFPIDTLMNCLIFIVGFETLYFTAKLILKIFNYFRGTGSGIEL